MSDTLRRLDIIFKKQFRDPNLKLTQTTSAQDIPKWDSFAQISLVLAIEATFNIRLPTNKVMEMKNVGDMIDYINNNEK